MPQKFSSPGVFTTEIDKSNLNESTPGVGAVVIGRTPKGPAMVPIRISGYSDFVERFGGVDPYFQLPYAAKNYLKNANSLTVMRVLGHADGTGVTSGYQVGGITAIADTSGSAVSTASNVLAVIHHSGTINVVTVAGVSGDANNFVVRIGSAFAATASFVTSSANYITKVLNTDPTLYDTYGHYLYQNFGYAVPAASASWSAVAVTMSLSAHLRDFEGGKTTWVKSQPLGGVEFDLFRIWTLGHGRATNDDVKVTIANVKPSANPNVYPYGTFDILVRRFEDTDLDPKVIETFSQLNLDPSSVNYVLRRVGDSYETFDTVARKMVVNGTYPRRSNKIRIELNTAANFPPEALPWGHRGFEKMAFSAVDQNTATAAHVIPALPLVQTLNDTNGNFQQNICWGVNFTSGSIVDRMRAFPDLSASQTNLTASDSDFSMKFLTSSYSNGQLRYAYSTATPTYLLHQPVFASSSLYKFTMPFIGGFDGWDLRVKDELYLDNAADVTDVGVTSLKRAIDVIANPDYADFNVLAIPGIHNLRVTDYARTLVNDRRDAIYIMDITGSTVAQSVDLLKNRNIDDSYSACYYPDLKLNDRVSNRIVRVSPSVAVLGALAYSDAVGQVFFAPAGMTRGGLGQFDIIDVVDRLTFQDRDDLYTNRINAIATFPVEGIVIWGQKTLQLRSSSLDRVNVRRLLIFAKRAVSTVAKGLLFEPNNSNTWQRFRNSVNPILDRIRQDQGVEKFLVVMDSSTNTQETIDRNIMVGKIFLQPIRAAEYIDISFVITNAGVSFND